MRDSWTKRNERNSRKLLKKRILPAKRWRVPVQETERNSAKGKSKAEPPSVFNQSVVDEADLASLMTSFGISKTESSRKVLGLQRLGDNDYNVSAEFLTNSL
jgi:hypothetical protein